MRKQLEELWKYSIPLIPNQLSWWIINCSDRTIISSLLGIAANGVYAFVNKLSSIVIIFFNIFNLTWAESASVHIKDDNSSEYFTKVFNLI